MSSPETKRELLARPHVHAGSLTDLVSGRRFEPGESSPRLDVADRILLFPGPEELAAFRADPARYLPQASSR